MDKITIKNLKIFAYHGVLEDEKKNGQEFIVDVDYYLNMTKACHSDEIDDTVSYADVVETIKRAFTSKKYNLIEKVAQVVADAVLDDFEPISKIEVTVKKPNAPVDAEFDYMAVTIAREE